MSTERLVPATETRAHVVRQHLARYEFAARMVGGRSVLDVACGSGYGSALLKGSGAARVVGLDVSEEAVAYARRRFEMPGVEFVKGSAERIHLNGPFDVIVSFETIEHLHHPEAFLEETVRLLAGDGALIVSTPVRLHGALDTKPANPHHVREWAVDEFWALLSRYYQHVEIQGQYTFRKSALPYSRTIKRWLFARRFPADLAEVDQINVRRDSPVFPGFAFAMAFAVAVCRRRPLRDEPPQPT
jgi:SAM-dependent methyltransferase